MYEERISIFAGLSLTCQEENRKMGACDGVRGERSPRKLGKIAEVPLIPRKERRREDGKGGTDSQSNS